MDRALKGTLILTFSHREKELAAILRPNSIFDSGWDSLSLREKAGVRAKPVRLVQP